MPLGVDEQREQELTIYRLCVGLASTIRKRLGLHPRKCALCGHEDVRDEQVQEVAARQFSHSVSGQ